MTTKPEDTVRDAVRSRAEGAHVEAARDVLAIEREALERASSRLGPSFAAAVRAILESPGTVIVFGVGKSGIVARGGLARGAHPLRAAARFWVPGR